MGDYTTYVRGQFEEGKASRTGKFSKDGFDRWAESSAPARVGQMEKEPAETTNTMPRQMSERDVGGSAPFMMAAAPYLLPRKTRARKDKGGVLPLLAPAAIAAAPYVVPAVAGFAAGVYSGIKGQRKVDKMRQQIAREERQKLGGASKGVMRAMEAAESRVATGGVRGAGFREGVRQTQDVYGNLADAAVYGYDAYESAKKGVTGLPGALRSGAQVAESVIKVKTSAKKAADEFSKGGAKPDGRAARAAIVKQVMAQRGVSMIQASSIVKNEGLYKKA